MSALDDASLAASLFAVDPAGLGGVCLRSLAQPARSQWLQILRDLLPPAIPIRRIPFNIADARLLGGLDLTATLRANRPIAERGVLAATDGGVVVVTMAERLSPHTAACLDAVLDRGEIVMDREGVQISDQARVGVVALDESMAEDERVPTGLLDRLAFLVDLNGFELRSPLLPLHDAEQILEARRCCSNVSVSPELVSALCATAMALGAGSVRVSILAVQAARVLAALEGRAQANHEDAVTAGRLVFAPRATQVPQSEAQPEAQSNRDPAEDSGDPAESPPPAPSTPPPSSPPQSIDNESGESGDSSEASKDERQKPEAEAAPDLDEMILAATQAAIPAGLLNRLRVDAAAGRGPAGAAGRVGTLRKGGTRGRPSGISSGPPRGHARLNVMETLRAAAPWQRLRGRVDAGEVRTRVRIDPSDFRITRYQQRAQTLTIFAVDASGSSALNRLAEAKGAVELLLADCYVRRDQVAVVTFRGRKAELLLPPTRSLVRAKRNLAGLPGGGGTPLAAAIDCALLLAIQAQRRGDTPLLVLLTDGRANVARDGTGGREAAHRDALQAARQLRRARIATLFVDTSTRPNPLAESLASAMNAQYIPLPYASAQALSSVVTAVASRAQR